MTDNSIHGFLDHFEKKEGVYFSDKSLVNENFEAKYIRVREKENRILNDHELARLPLLKNHPLANEWKMRARSSQRVVRYFKGRAGSLLDLGCGNGWFTNLLAEKTNMDIVGLDINFAELAQASRVFKLPNLFFVYGDVFAMNIPEQLFDYITLNASIQYFGDINMILESLMKLLKSNGEIHIIDSPFYAEDELQEARDRTLQYYEELGFPEMGSNYFHHTYTEIQKWNFEKLYWPSQKNSLIQIFSKKDIPFPWLKIVNSNG
jgi:ubiquinone/menaquinone biosynthesis C-methylase UbiE